MTRRVALPVALVVVLFAAAAVRAVDVCPGVGAPSGYSCSVCTPASASVQCSMSMDMSVAALGVGKTTLDGVVSDMTYTDDPFDSDGLGGGPGGVHPGSGVGPSCCYDFNTGTGGFGACAFAPNVDVVSLVGGQSGGAADNRLHLIDGAGTSLVCGPSCASDWTPFLTSGCGALCFDYRVDYDGCVPGIAECDANGGWIEFRPQIIIATSNNDPTSPGVLRARFLTNERVTDAKGPKGGWHHYCAPLGPRDSLGNMPSNADGFWQALHPTTTNHWEVILANVQGMQLSIDYTSNPAERVDYDNICLKNDACPPVSCPDTGSFTRTWAGNQCNAALTVPQTISVIDTVQPTLTLNTPVVVVPPAQCGTVPPLSPSDYTVSDACDCAPVVTSSFPGGFTCGVDSVRRITATDAHGNAVSVDQIVRSPCCGLPDCSATERQFWCVAGVTDQYYSCWLPWERGFRPCPPGTRCQHPGVHPVLSSHDGSGACEPDGFD